MWDDDEEEEILDLSEEKSATSLNAEELNSELGISSIKDRIAEEYFWTAPDFAVAKFDTIKKCFQSHLASEELRFIKDNYPFCKGVPQDVPLLSEWEKTTLQGQAAKFDSELRDIMRRHYDHIRIRPATYDCLFNIQSQVKPEDYKELLQCLVDEDAVWAHTSAGATR
eukprot:GEZU01015356.1.p1 GENE.GEZU01015356.1~~GEZU01015356.1.p1  ORF type:complete len:168 (+),score=47.86 GEZU01015356.1:361-864(+)